MLKNFGSWYLMVSVVWVAVVSVYAGVHGQKTRKDFENKAKGPAAAADEGRSEQKEEETGSMLENPLGL